MHRDLSYSNINYSYLISLSNYYSIIIYNVYIYYSVTIAYNYFEIYDI